MVDRAQIVKAIQKIAQSPNNVTQEQIEWVVQKLGGLQVRKTRHGYLYRIGTRRFMVNSHNPGSKHVKSYSVRDFLDAMADFGIWED